MHTLSMEFVLPMRNPSAVQRAPKLALETIILIHLLVLVLMLVLVLVLVVCTKRAPISSYIYSLRKLLLAYMHEGLRWGSANGLTPKNGPQRVARLDG
jgi:hypothetical protein